MISNGNLYYFFMPSFFTRLFWEVLKILNSGRGTIFQNTFLTRLSSPRKARRRYWFLYLLVYLCVNLSVCQRLSPWLNENRRRPEIWYTYLPWAYLKYFFCFFEKITPSATIFEKLLRHADYHIYPRLPCMLFYQNANIQTIVAEKSKILVIPHSCIRLGTLYLENSAWDMW